MPFSERFRQRQVSMHFATTHLMSELCQTCFFSCWPPFSLRVQCSSFIFSLSSLGLLFHFFFYHSSTHIWNSLLISHWIFNDRNNIYPSFDIVQNYIFLRLSKYVSVSVCLALALFLVACTRLYKSLYVGLSVCRSVGLSVCCSVGLFFCLSVGLLVSLSSKNFENWKIEVLLLHSECLCHGARRIFLQW